MMRVNVDDLDHRGGFRTAPWCTPQRVASRCCQSSLHKPLLHGCSTDTPAHTHPIYPAAAREYQTRLQCVNPVSWVNMLKAFLFFFAEERLPNAAVVTREGC